MAAIDLVTPIGQAGVVGRAVEKIRINGSEEGRDRSHIRVGEIGVGGRRFGLHREGRRDVGQRHAGIIATDPVIKAIGIRSAVVIANIDLRDQLSC